jgi:UDP-glucose:(heptosyl)LPS alpha-1,3-glucosyltransferase
MRLALNYQRIDPARGGAETYVVDLCHRLVRAGHQVDLYAESWREGVLPDRVRCIAVPSTGRTRLERIWSFGRNSETALRQVAYDCTIGLINTWYHDVIIPQGGVHAGSLEASAKRFPAGWRRAVYVLGKKAQPKHWVYQAIEQKQYDPAQGAIVVAVSQMVKDHVNRHHHVARSRIRVIPNAIDPERLIVQQPGAVRCRVRNELGIGPKDLVGLFVGHNFRLKGLQPLLLALAERRARNPGGRPIRLLVCGNGAIGPFRRLAARLGLGESVRFAGFYPDIRGAYRASDFFVQPTFYDPCSLVVFEALACGLPVITTSCNGASELMTDGREGSILTAPDALGELVVALDHMADDEIRHSMGVHALALGRAQSLDTHVARLVKVFEEVATTKARRGPHIPRSVGRKNRI